MNITIPNSKSEQELVDFESKMQQDKEANGRLVGLFSVLYKVNQRLEKQNLENKKTNLLKNKII